MTTSFYLSRVPPWSYSLWMILALAAPGCQKQSQEPSASVESPAFASTVHTGDAKSAGQLVNGFYGIEQNSWRWTAQQFAVKLHPPVGSGQSGATLMVTFTVPDVLIRNLHSVALTPAIGGVSLPTETYSKPGNYSYKQDVAANLLTADPVRVDFQLDHSIPPGQDKRQLGIIVLSVGLESK